MNLKEQIKQSETIELVDKGNVIAIYDRKEGNKFKIKWSEGETKNEDEIYDIIMQILKQTTIDVFFDNIKYNKGMVVLSLFDGISCGRIALERANIKVKTYYASEIKKHAIKCSQEHYKDIIQLGDVTKIHYSNGILYTENGEFNVGEIDLLIGGSPCQDFSIANKNRLGLEGMKSRLFYEYLRLLEEIKPKYFLLENVRMKQEAEKQLNSFLGVKGFHIDSKLFSYQTRHRIYWTNLKIEEPKDLQINFQDFKGIGDIDEAKVNKTPSRIRMWNDGVKTDFRTCKNITYCDKVGCITRKQDRSQNSGLIAHQDFCRFLTRAELEMAQTLPIGYTKSLSYNQAQDVIGDGWTVDVVAHIFRSLNKL